MKSAVLYALWIFLTIVVYPNIDVFLYKFLAIRDLDILFSTSMASFAYIVYQLRLALSSNLEDKSTDQIASLIPLIVGIISFLYIELFYEGHLYRDWYYNIIIVSFTVFIDFFKINYIGNLILKNTSVFTPTAD